MGRAPSFARLASIVALTALVAGGCDRPWLLEVTVDLDPSIEMPADVYFDITELDAVGGTSLDFFALRVDGSDLFVDGSRSGAILIRPDLEARAITIMAFARNASNELLAIGFVSAAFSNGHATETLVLAPPGGVDSGLDGGLDGGDGGSDGGVDLPTTPVLRTPINGDETADLTPAFSWEASTLVGPGTIDYLVEWDVDATFASAAGGYTPTLTFSPPTPLAVSTTPPEGERYYWHVRACIAGSPGLCSAYTPVRYLDVGRSAHDFNGDAFADFAGGAPGYMTDNGAAVASAGETFPTGSFDALYVFGTDQRSGTSAAVAGDLNHDGFADLIVGCDEGVLPAENGAVRIMFGADQLAPPTVPNGVLNGFTAGDRFGYAAAAAGDVNGDGHDDVIVGAPFNDAAGSDAGAAYLFLGGPGTSFDVAPDLVITGLFAGDELGAAVAGAGDVNGDGYHDVIVGARHGGNILADDMGAAYIFYGNETAMLDSMADETLLGETGGDAFGAAVAGGGDLNGDGFSDVLVGAPASGLGGANAGAAYVYYGGAGGLLLPVTLIGAGVGDSFGSSVAMGGDLNGDGFDDLAVGAPSAGVPSVGRVTAFFGTAGTAFDTLPDGLPAPPGSVTAMVRFGASISIVGDFNGDGFDDLVVGAPDYSGFGGGMMRMNNGILYLFVGGSGAVIEPNFDLVLPGGLDDDHLGTSVG